MSKNTNTSGFRKIDIDAFDPENYKDDDDQNNQPDERGPNEQEITNDDDDCIMPNVVEHVDDVDGWCRMMDSDV